MLEFLHGVQWCFVNPHAFLGVPLWSSEPLGDSSREGDIGERVGPGGGQALSGHEPCRRPLVLGTAVDLTDVGLPTSARIYDQVLRGQSVH